MVTEHYFVFDDVKSTDMDVILLNYDPILIPRSKRVYINIPGKDGSIPAGSDAKEDVFTDLYCAIIGDNELDVMQKLRQIKPWLSKRGKLSFWDEPDKYYMAELDTSIHSVKRTTWDEFVLTVRCHPIAYGTEVTEDIDENPLYNNGSYPAAGILKITMEADSPNLKITLQNTGEYLYLEDELKAGDVILIDLENEHITKNEISVMDKLYITSDFFVIPPGEYTITIDPYNPAQLTYIERWL